jgi:threonine/homoserine/homoserine lactone efflux protein
MFGIHDLWLFVVSGLLLNVTPGPDTLYIAGRSSTLGFRAGAVAALGVAAGIMVHIFAAALGLSAILAASATAFMVVKMTGAAYLVYIGVSLILSCAARRIPAVMDHQPAALRGVFMQGFCTNVLNPKVALFFLAFLPQFVSSGARSKTFALLLLGAIFNLNGTLWNLLVARVSARMSGLLTASTVAGKWFNRCVGGLFVGVGIRLALTHER